MRDLIAFFGALFKAFRGEPFVVDNDWWIVQNAQILHDRTGANIRTACNMFWAGLLLYPLHRLIGGGALKFLGNGLLGLMIMIPMTFALGLVMNTPEFFSSHLEWYLVVGLVGGIFSGICIALTSERHFPSPIEQIHYGTPMAKVGALLLLPFMAIGTVIAIVLFAIPVGIYLLIKSKFCPLVVYKH